MPPPEAEADASPPADAYGQPASPVSPGSGKRRRRRRRRRRRGGEQSTVTPTLEGCRDVARRRFGIDRLHPQQEIAMEAVLNGQDTMVVLPTGFGKSLIYQVPAMIVDRPTIVVSPLIALMADQEQSLKRRGVPVIRLDSTLPAPPSGGRTSIASPPAGASSS